MQNMPNLDNVRYSSLEEEFSEKKENLKSIWETNASKGAWNVHSSQLKPCLKLIVKRNILDGCQGIEGACHMYTK
jgi:hypothetical protein